MPEQVCLGRLRQFLDQLDGLGFAYSIFLSKVAWLQHEELNPDTPVSSTGLFLMLLSKTPSVHPSSFCKLSTSNSDVQPYFGRTV
jgi:hypothetical protein